MLRQGDDVGHQPLFDRVVDLRQAHDADIHPGLQHLLARQFRGYTRIG